MLTELSAAVLTSILLGLAPAAWALTAAESGGAAESADLAGHPPSPAHGSDAVSDAVAAVANADWNATFEAWKSQHADATCQERDDCHLCRVQSGSGFTELSFYALGGEDPPHCRLYEVRHVLAGTPEQLAEVEAALSARFGSATHPDTCPFRKTECYYISDVRRWEHADLEIVAYREPQNVVLARSAPLRAARRTQDELEEHKILRPRIVDLVAAELGDRAARFRHAALAETTTEILAELRAFLDEAGKVEGPPQYALRLAADVLAERLAAYLPEVTADLPKGLTFEDDHYGGWRYRNDLVQGVLRDAPEASSAHDLALLMMLDMGLDPGRDCYAGVDLYHGVVREAGAFLSKRPDSRYRADVTYLLAQAYETWWSVSLGEGGLEEPEKAREGAEAARERAVELYQQIVRAEPTSDYARYANFVLPRLRLRRDTGQERFVCINE